MMEYKSKWISKKFLFAIGYSVVASISAAMGDPIDPDLLKNVGMVVAGWIGVEGIADIMAMSKVGADSIVVPEGQSKLQSRKFWVMLLFGPFMMANEHFGMPVPIETMEAVLTTIGSWFGVQGIEDGVKRWKIKAAQREVLDGS